MEAVADEFTDSVLVKATLRAADCGGPQPAALYCLTTPGAFLISATSVLICSTSRLTWLS
jgi:hypothetical protein